MFPAAAHAAVAAAKTIGPDLRTRLEGDLESAYRTGNLESTVRAAKRLVQLQPEHARARLLLGTIAWREGNMKLALEQLGRSAVSDPECLETWRVLGRVASEARELAVARQAYMQACRVEPGTKSDGDLALHLCYAGDWADGWALAECRLDDELRKNGLLHKDLDRAPRPYWNGSPIDGTLLVVHEGGFGDSIQFARYLAGAKACARRLIVKVPSALERLYACLRADGLEIDATPKVVPAFDAFCFHMSLPHLLKAPEPRAMGAYLDARRLPQEKRLPASAGRPRIGVVWGGTPLASRDPLRSLPVGHLADLIAATPDLEWHSIQQGPHRKSIAEVRRQLERRGASPDLFMHEHDADDFADTAAIAIGLDLIVTVDTSVAHLCGALGLDTWVMLATCPDYRYGPGKYSPWYASMKMFRQPAPGRWDQVVENLVKGLKDRFS